MTTTNNTIRTPKRVRLVKITLLAAFAAEEGEAGGAGLESTAEGLAELLRDGGALTVASMYDDATTAVHEDDDDNEGRDNMLDALLQRFPEDVLPVGPVPGVHVLGRNGTFKNARLVREERRTELWLGTEKEKFPFVSFPDSELEEHYPVPTGKRRRAGVEYGCGKVECADCYEPAKGRTR